MQFGAQLRWDNFILENGEVDTASIELFRAAGFKYFFLSIESTSSEALGNMGKKQLQSLSDERREEIIKNVFAALKEAGIDYGICTIRGYEGDTRESFERTIRTIAEIKPKYIFIEIAKVYPGTPDAENFADPGVLEDIYTWGGVEGEELETTLSKLRRKLFMAAPGTISPEEDGFLIMIDPEEARRSLESAAQILTASGYRTKNNYKSAFVRAD